MQKNNMETMVRILRRTEMPTKTVAALKAGLKMDEKFQRLPMQRMSGSLKRPSSPPATVDLKK